MVPAPSLDADAVRRLAVGALVVAALEQPSAFVGAGRVDMHRLPVLCRRDGRGVLHRRLGDHARKAGEEGVGDGVPRYTVDWDTP